MRYARLDASLIKSTAADSLEHDASTRRALVLTDEQSKNAFRATLPAHVRSDEFAAPAEVLWRLTREDVKGFVSAYVAAFAAMIVFIA